MAYDMLNNNLPDDTICTDSHTLSSSSTNDMLPMAYVNVSSTTGGSPTVAGAKGEEINSEVTYSPDNSTTKLTVGILDELKKHNIVQTSQVEHDSSKSCGWRPKRSICIVNGCKTRTPARYCEYCDSGRRDFFWLCKKHENEHQQRILTMLQKIDSSP
jgi:hypothetical protein